MGCDIHDWAEVFRDGKWERLGNVFQDSYREAALSEHPSQRDSRRCK
jgi:hypothetical protein